MLCFAVLAALFLWPVTLGGRVLLPGTFLAHFLPWASQAPALEREPAWNPLLWDALAQYYPWRWFLRENLLAGRLPLWNPYAFGGMPFLANGQSAVYYPFNLLGFALLPFERAFGWLAWLHLTLAGFFTWGFLRALGLRAEAALVGGGAFAFCGFMVTWLELPPLVQTATWLPAVLWGLERAFQGRMGGLLGGGAALGLAALAGHLQIFAYIALAALAYGLFRLGGLPLAWRWKATALLGVGLIGGLLGAAQVLPSLELMRWSHRHAQPTEEGYRAYLARSLSPLYWVTFFLPDFFGHPTRGDYWGPGHPEHPLVSPGDYTEFNGYLGLMPLWLLAWGIASRRRREATFFGLFALAALSLAFGAALNRWLYFHVPGFASAGGPCRMVLLYLFSASVLAALGAEEWVERGWGRVGRWAGGAILGLTLLAWLYTWNCLALMPNAPSHWGERFSREARPLLHWAVFFLLSGVWLRLGFRWPSPLPLGGVLALTVADLFTFGFPFNPTAPSPTLYHNAGLRARWAMDSHSRQIILPPRWSLNAFPQAVFPPNTGMVYGFRELQGYDSLYLSTYKRWMNALEGGETSPLENGNMVFVGRSDPSIWMWLGVERVLAPRPLPGLAQRGWKEEQWQGVYLYRAPQKVSRVHLYPPDACRDVSWEETLEALREGGGGVGQFLMTEPGGLCFPPGILLGKEEVEWLRDEPNRVQWRVVSLSALLLTDPYVPGWKAWWNEEPVEIFRGWGLFRVVVGLGEGRVTMVYHPLSVRLGQFALGWGLLLLAWMAVAYGKGKRQG